MGKISYYEHTNESLSEVCNDAIGFLLQAALVNNSITREIYDELMEYKIVVAPPSMWGRFYTKLIKKTEDGAFMYVVKPQGKIHAKD